MSRDPVAKPTRRFAAEHNDIFDRLHRRSIVSRDGTRIAYEVIGDGPRTMALANGLGGRVYAWIPLIRAFGDRYRFITWDYRGLFDSESPETIRRLSVRDHAEDLKELLDAEGVTDADLVGWSMGVQVCLEFAGLYPDVPRSLTLVNGTYGQIFSSALQPVVRLPLAHELFHGLAEVLASAPTVSGLLGWGTQMGADTLLWLRKRVYPRANSMRIRALSQYVHDVFGTNVVNYYGLFQQIDAHSAYHLLPHINTPTLVISGALDVLTPAFQSRVLARRLPNATHIALTVATHFVIFERPGRVIDAMGKHLDALA